MARQFFETQFLSKAFDTRQQILTRLWGILSNRVLARMFSHEKNRLDMFAAMNRGSVILVNTAKELLALNRNRHCAGVQIEETLATRNRPASSSGFELG